MSKKPDALDLDAIEARAKAATPGPWAEGVADATSREAYLARIAERVVQSPLVTFPCVWVPGHKDTILGDDALAPKHAVVVCDLGNGPEGDVNMQFIAAARSDVPALVARVRELEAALRIVVDDLECEQPLRKHALATARAALEDR